MLPAALDFEHYRGDDFKRPIEIIDHDGEDKDLTGYALRMHVKKTRGGDTLIELSDGEGLEVETGLVTIRIDREKLSELDPGEYVYDLEVTDPDNTVRTWLTGKITIVEQVTA